MQVFWYQGGLHIKPDNDVETEAILVLLDGLRAGKPTEIDGLPVVSSESSASGQVERGLDLDF